MVQLPPQTLANKVAIVTGASRGLGSTMATSLAKRGAKVVLTYTSPSSKSKADTLVAEIKGYSNGSDAIAIAGELAQIETPAHIVSHTLSAFGAHIDILVNNAAVETQKYLVDITAADHDALFAVNVRAPLLLTAAVVPHLRAPGRIINITSIAARARFATCSLYVAAKAALEGYTRVWAEELGAKGTTVNAVAPGPVESDMLNNFPRDLV